MRRVLGAAATLLVGVLAGFFFVFNALFSDGPSSLLHPEYLVVYGLLLVVYGGAAFAATRWSGWGASSAAWLATPGAAVVVLYGEPSLALRGLVLLWLAVGTAGGVLLALRRRATPRP